MGVKAISTQRGEAVEELVRRHQAPLRSFLIYLGCAGSLADDVVQDVFLSVLSAGFEDRGHASTSAYLRRVAKNKFLKAMQRARREPPMKDLDEAEDVWVELRGPERGGNRYLDALRECLAGVEDRARRVLGLRYTERLARTAIAEQLEMSESGVNSLLVRTRKKLRSCVERRLAG